MIGEWSYGGFMMNHTAHPYRSMFVSVEFTEADLAWFRKPLGH